ncbi:MAG: thioredoxin family protein [bacterium]
MFWANGCSHCAKEKEFLKKIEKKYEGKIKVNYFEITENRDNAKLLLEAGKTLKADVSGIPFTVIGSDYITGWYSSDSTGKLLEEQISSAINGECDDIVGGLIEPAKDAMVNNNRCPEIESSDKGLPEKINVPLFGEINLGKLSLPVLTLVLGILDGFNPCAMWILLFLISLLLGMRDRKRMWILGSTFIFVSALVYFLFMSAWLNLFLFLGFVLWVRIIIALVALASGGYNLKDYFTSKKEGGCSVAEDEKRRNIFEKLKHITQSEKFWFAFAGIILLAFSVNLVEMICSAGFPAVYTQILTLAHIAKWKYYLYLLFYIFLYMFDDLVIFIIAMITLRATGVSTKYGRMSRLIGGILMLLIGILLLFKPHWLMDITL